MIKQNRKLLLTAKYKLIIFGKKKKKKLSQKNNCVGHVQWVSQIRGKQKLFYFWPKDHEHDIKMKRKI